MIVLSTPTFDVNGSVALPRSESSETTGIGRRVSRTATLDGGVVINDTGYSAGDRTLTITSESASRALYDQVAYLVKNYSLLIVACADGLFLGAPSGLQMSGGDLRLTILVQEDMTEA